MKKDGSPPHAEHGGARPMKALVTRVFSMALAVALDRRPARHGGANMWPMRAYAHPLPSPLVPAPQRVADPMRHAALLTNHDGIDPRISSA